MAKFVPGLRLSETYHREIVRPILARSLPHLVYAAGRIGTGSDVLGFDTPMSADHDWGLRLQLFVPPDREEEVDALLDRELPATFLELPVRFPTSDGRPSRHQVEVLTVEGFFQTYLGIDLAQEIEPADWLTFPEQKLLTITEGPVFHDEMGLNGVRARFAASPEDVWRYQLASVWERIGQEEHLVGRAGYVGDEIGAALIASRLVRDVMRLAFLLERRYAPYPKWFGTAFARLASGPTLTPLLQAVLRAEGWRERDAALIPMYEAVAGMQNESGVAEPRPAQATLFFDRPFHVIEHTSGFAPAIRQTIRDPRVQAIAARRNIGGFDVFSDSTDLLSAAEWRPPVRGLFDPGRNAPGISRPA